MSPFASVDGVDPEQQGIPVNEDDSIDLYIPPGNFDDGTFTLWVELLRPSQSLGDYRIEATYRGIKDAVSLTAVWAYFGAAKFDTQDKADVFTEAPWSRVENPVRKLIEDVGGTGSQPSPKPTAANPQPAPTGWQDGMMEQWIVGPPGIRFVDRVKWDHTRQIEQRTLWDGKQKFATAKPILRDEANDDDDETQYGPNALGELFGSDAPGHRPLPSPRFLFPFGARVIQRTDNFNSFVRVSFDGNKPIGDKGIFGSRASDFFEWHHIFNLIYVDANSRWEEAFIELDVGHKPLPQPQP